ncbi:MAG TPA: EAL domain-containing protein [Pyrinomonadaceae bacterium]|nr:EAL domain-containing protein [Pyrinomonadaceae bacterium]
MLDQEKLAAIVQRLFNAEIIGFIFTDTSGLIKDIDVGLLKMLGYERALITSEQLTLAQITPNEHHASDAEAFEKVSAFGFCGCFEKELVHKNGMRIPVLSGAVRTESEIAWFIIDLSQVRQYHDHLNHLAYHDALTDLPNQALFKDRLKQAIALYQRNNKPGAQALAVLLLNLDRFKTVNDSLGYTAGDRVLQSVAERLTSCVRTSDTVARFGGDEFAVLLLNIRPQDAANTARAIKQALDQAFLFDDQELFLTSSIGISLYPYDGLDTPALLKSAGTALERAKESGGNNFQFYTSGRTTAALKQLLLESNMRPGLERGEFRVEYQPQVQLNNFRLVGMEALARWEHPTLGLLYPNEFMTLAEDSGLIVQIGDWVMQVACLQTKAWQDAGLEPLRLAINFSARQFQQSNFISTVEEIVKQTNLQPGLLELELTESCLVKEPDLASEKLQELRRMGIKIAIDDFGTGYSSFYYLKRFPVDTLKIDKSFIQDVCSTSHAAAIVRAIVTLGHALDLQVVAEGVETEGQLDFLNSVGCDVVQGFLFSPSLTASAFEELLIEQKRASANGGAVTAPLRPLTGALHVS